MRIVYVEDDLTNVALIERICQMNMDELTTYGDAESALAALDLETADLILMDIDLGTRSMNGLQLTRMLRQKGINVPIIAITANDMVSYEGEYIDAGCNDFVLKPVSVPRMINLINVYR